MLKLAYFHNDKNTLESFHQDLNKDFLVVPEELSSNYAEVLEQGPYDAIIIDIEMPRIDGFQLFEKITNHGHYNGCPVIFMTDDSSDKTTLFALQLGAEDVIHRRWSPEIRAERIRQRVKRYIKEYIYQIGNLRIDKKRYKVTVDNQHIILSITEFKLLCSLVSMYPAPIPFSDVMSTVWGDDMDEKNLHTHQSNLRKKLKGWHKTFKAIGGRQIGIVSN